MVNLGQVGGASGGIGGAFGGSFAGAFAGGASIQIIIRAIDQYSKEFKNATTASEKLGKALKLLAIASAGALVASAKLAITYERTEMAFTSMLGSAFKAQKLLAELREFTRRTPFILPDLEENAKLLLGMGIEADELIDTMSMLGDVASALNVPFWRMALNFGQVKTQAYLMGTELRDFGRMGVPIIEALTKVLGKSAAEVKGMKGTITYEETLEAFKIMTSEGGRFFNFMQNAVETTSGKWSVLKDEVIKLGRAIGENLLPIINKAIDAVAKLARNFNDMTTEQREKVANIITGGLVTTVAAGAVYKGAEMYASLKGVSPTNPLYTWNVNEKGGMGVGEVGFFATMLKMLPMIAVAIGANKLATEVSGTNPIQYLLSSNQGDYSKLNENAQKKIVEELNKENEVNIKRANIQKTVNDLTFYGNTVLSKYIDYKNEEFSETQKSFSELSIEYNNNRNALEELKTALDSYNNKKEEIENNMQLNNIDKILQLNKIEEVYAEKREYIVTKSNEEIVKSFEKMYSNITDRSGAFMDWYIEQMGGSISGGEYARVAGGGDISGAKQYVLNGRSVDEATYRDKYPVANDFISRPGAGIASFSPQDTIIGVKNPSQLSGGGGVTVNVYASNIVGNDAGEELAEILHSRLKNMVSI